MSHCRLGQTDNALVGIVNGLWEHIVAASCSRELGVRIPFARLWNSHVTPCLCNALYDRIRYMPLPHLHGVDSASSIPRERPPSHGSGGPLHLNLRILSAHLLYNHDPVGRSPVPVTHRSSTRQILQTQKAKEARRRLDTARKTSHGRLTLVAVKDR